MWNSRSVLSLTLSCALAAIAPAALAQNDTALPNSPAPAADAHGYSGRETTWRSLAPNFLHDQKEIWVKYPEGLVKGHHWVPTLAVAAGTAALIWGVDPHAARYFRNPATQHDRVNDAFDPMISTGEIIAIPVSLMAVGYARHDNYQVDTALLCAQSYGDSALVDLGIKAVTRRQRPADIPPDGSFTGTFFNGGKSPFKGSSFPSGHAAGAFSVATVVAERYRNHRWVPWAVYGMATAISLSRITTNAHFSSDVFLGATLGYTVAKYQVLRPQ